MISKLKTYVNKFNRDDEECYTQLIDNSKAFEFLKDNIPLIDIPDKLLEEIYYFRFWTLRKHLKDTSDGILITEFLPPVSWAGTHNTIIAALSHHVKEAKWLKNSRDIILNYIKFFLEEKTKTYLYSCPLIYSLYEYLVFINDFSFGIDNLDLLINYYKKTEQEHITPSGLFWSIDGNDAMEYSISGTDERLNVQKGIRPTLNSYMAANAYAISEFGRLKGDNKIQNEYLDKYNSIKEKINDVLYDGDFYKAVHNKIDDENVSTKDINLPQNVRELIGYIPWIYNLVPKGREKAFSYLKDENVFKTPYGFTTADKSHERYLFDVNHECLWNGYIWPFATSQTLYSVLNLLDNYDSDVLTNDDFYEFLHTYAKSHYLEKENGDKVCFIDEVIDPRTNIWSSREVLKESKWRKEKGGYERGKDYNHSTYCDLVLSGLLGIKVEDGKLTVNPKVPKDWKNFKVSNLYVGDTCYEITYQDGKIDIITTKN